MTTISRRVEVDHIINAGHNALHKLPNAPPYCLFLDAAAKGHITVISSTTVAVIGVF